jgi:tetratricopeptide (TPR) repeat protein
VIDSGALTGRPLAAAYAERGAARTLLRKLDEAEADFDQAIKIDPTYLDAPQLRDVRSSRAVVGT